MTRCARCCLHKSMRIVNLIMLLFGIGMILYSLWLQKKWNQGVSELPTRSFLPRPWFIFACFGVGIAVCLSTLCGHMLANCISNYILCMYIVFISCLLSLEVAVIVTIFFKMDWKVQIASYIDKYHQEFETFVIFQVKMCRLMALIILAVQINVIVLAVILWAVGTEPRTHCHVSAVPSFTQSFLVPNSPGYDSPRQSHRRSEILHGEFPGRSLLLYLLRLRFQRRITVN